MDIPVLLKVYFPDLIARYHLANTELTIQATIKIPQPEFINSKGVSEKGELIIIEEKTNSNQLNPKKKIKKYHWLQKRMLKIFY